MENTQNLSNPVCVKTQPVRAAHTPLSDVRNELRATIRVAPAQVGDARNSTYPSTFNTSSNQHLPSDGGNRGTVIFRRSNNPISTKKLSSSSTIVGQISLDWCLGELFRVVGKPLYSPLRTLCENKHLVYKRSSFPPLDGSFASWIREISESWRAETLVLLISKYSRFSTQTTYVVPPFSPLYEKPEKCEPFFEEFGDAFRVSFLKRTPDDPSFEGFQQPPLDNLLKSNEIQIVYDHFKGYPIFPDFPKKFSLADNTTWCRSGIYDVNWYVAYAVSYKKVVVFRYMDGDMESFRAQIGMWTFVFRKQYPYEYCPNAFVQVGEYVFPLNCLHPDSFISKSTTPQPYADLPSLQWSELPPAKTDLASYQACRAKWSKHSDAHYMMTTLLLSVLDDKAAFLKRLANNDRFSEADLVYDTKETRKSVNEGGLACLSDLCSFAPRSYFYSFRSLAVLASHIFHISSFSGGGEDMYLALKSLPDGFSVSNFAIDVAAGGLTDIHSLLEEFPNRWLFSILLSIIDAWRSETTVPKLVMVFTQIVLVIPSDIYVKVKNVLLACKNEVKLVGEYTPVVEEGPPRSNLLSLFGKCFAEIFAAVYSISPHGVVSSYLSVLKEFISRSVGCYSVVDSFVELFNGLRRAYVDFVNGKSLRDCIFASQVVTWEERAREQIHSISKYKEFRSKDFDRESAIAMCNELIKEGQSLVLDEKNAGLGNTLLSLRASLTVLVPSKTALRAQPYGLILYGGPGTGKTTAIDTIAGIVNMREGLPRTGNLVGNYRPSAKFQDCFNTSALTLLLNDVFSTKDEYMTVDTLDLLQSAVDVAAFQVNMASLTDKANSVINHKCTIVTTNVSRFLLTKSTGAEKLVRRFNVLHVELNVNDERVKELMTRYSLTPDKFMSCPFISKEDKDRAVRLEFYGMHCPSTNVISMEKSLDQTSKVFNSWSDFIRFFKEDYYVVMDAREKVVASKEELKVCKSHGLDADLCPGCAENSRYSLSFSTLDAFFLYSALNLYPFLFRAVPFFSILFLIVIIASSYYFPPLILLFFVLCYSSWLKISRNFHPTYPEKIRHAFCFLCSVFLSSSPFLVFMGWIGYLGFNSFRYRCRQFLVQSIVVNVRERFASESTQKKLRMLAILSFALGAYQGYKFFSRRKEEKEEETFDENINFDPKFILQSKVQGMPLNMPPEMTEIKNVYPARRRDNSWSRDLPPAKVMFFQGEGLLEQQFATNFGRGLFAVNRHFVDRVPDDSFFTLDYGDTFQQIYKRECLFVPHKDLVFFYASAHVSTNTSNIAQCNVGDSVLSGSNEVKITRIVGSTVFYRPRIYQAGDCGKMFFTDAGILGIHRGRTDVAGELSEGLFEMISKEDLECAIKHFGGSFNLLGKIIHENVLLQKLPISEGVHPRSDHAWLQKDPDFREPLEIIGHLPSINKTTLSGCATDLCQFVEGPVKERPNARKAQRGPDGKYVSLFTKRLGGYSKMVLMRPEWLDWLRQPPILPKKKDIVLGFISTHQALAGDPNCRYVNARETDKSVGKLLSSMNITPENAVKVDLKSEPITYTPHPLLLLARKGAKEKLQKGEIVQTYYTGVVKDEMVKEGGFLSGKGRYFLVGDYHMLLLSKEMFSNWAGFYLDNHMHFGCFADINTHDWKQWEEMYYYVTYGGTHLNVFEGDHAKMDCKHCSLNELYILRSNQYAEHVGYTNEEREEMTTLLLSLSCSAIELSGNVYSDNRSLQSGRFDTLIKNSIVNKEILDLCAVVYYKQKFGVFPTRALVFDNNRCGTCGDDFLYNPIGPFADMPGDFISQIARCAGFEVTSSDKNDPVLKRIPMSRATFLRRNFVMNAEGRVTSPLALDSITGALRYEVGVSPGMEHQRTQETINSQSLELFQHGEEVYNRIREQVLLANQNLSVPYKFPTFSESRDKFMSGVRPAYTKEEISRFSRSFIC